MVPLGLKSTSETSMVRTAVSALGLLIILPASVILYLFRENLEGKGIVLFLVLVLAILGFWLIFAFVRAITQVQRGLSGMSAGEVDSLQIQGAPAQLQEMGEIINSLNTLTREFRENTKQLESFIRQFATLSELTEVTAKVPDINDLLSLVLDKAMSASLARRGTVLLLSAETSMLDIVATEGWDGESLDPVALHESLAHRVIATGKPLLVHDLDDEASLEQCNNSQRYTSPSCLIMPLKAKTSVFGAVCLSEKVSGAFTDSDMQFLTVLL